MGRTEHLVQLDDVQICAESFGDPRAVPVVLVMGATASMLWWPERLCQSIADAGYWVVRYDHRDTGRSTTCPPGAASYCVEDLVGDLLGLMTSIGISSAHLVGMSLGGYVGQIAAVTDPDRVRSLTLIGSEPLGATDDLPGIDETFMAHFASMGELDWSDRSAVSDFLIEIGRLSAGSPNRFDEAETRARVAAEIDRAIDIASAFNHATVGTNQDWTGAIDRIDAPTLVIHGDHDPILPLANGEAIADRIAGATLHVLRDAGHELHSVDLDEICETIVVFLDAADQRLA